jgi:uncharacterized protein YcaQ
MDDLPLIPNSALRRVILHLQGLSIVPHTKLGANGLLDLIDQMGFVQVDSINTVERAHHMILFARNQTYRPAHLKKLHEKDGSVFENWTHDASIIPSRFYPYWRHRFSREAVGLRERWRKWRREGFEEVIEDTLDRVHQNGELMSRHLLGDGPKKPKSGDGWWDWHPSKTALEYLWRTGALCVARREGFQKVYDLPERAVDTVHLEARCGEDEFIDWACSSALRRLGFATHGEIAAFWGMISPAMAKDWCEARLGNEIVQVLAAPADGSVPKPVYAQADYENLMATAPKPPARLRVLSPFDPVIRDRKRLSRLFGYEYRIEVFVPEAKRIYGYYVFPLLEGDRLVGRIDMKHDRKTGVLGVRAAWLEPGVKMTSGRAQRLEAELERIRKFTAADQIVYADGWLKTES